jgi:DTW domain-containing protein YfiP
MGEPAAPEHLYRRWCHTCRRPETTCLCGCITAVPTRTRFVLLMHPREYRKTRNGTGRITHLSLRRSEVHVGVDFRQHERVNALIDAPDTDCRLLYPGPGTQNLSRGEYHPHPGRRPVFFLIDGTWACARTVLRRSDNVRGLPRVGFDLTATSGFAIKRQPRPECLATVEAAHRCLTLLAADGHEDFGPEEGRLLLAPFRRIMEIQMGYPGLGQRNSW